MSTIRDVARAAGVSVATVSRALTSPEKVSATSRALVEAAVLNTGYRPNLLARNFRSARSYSVVVLLPDITNPFFSEVIQAIEDRAQDRGYAVLLGDTRESLVREQDYVNRVETRLADGVIQLRPQSKSSGEHNIPWVNACGGDHTTGPSIRIDNAGAAAKAVEYIIGLGHTRIAVFTGKPDNPHTQERLQGFRATMAAHGLTVNEQWVMQGDFTVVSGQRLAQSLCEQVERPTAVFCLSDRMAIGAIQVLRSHGLAVPRDMTVVGFDDIKMARYLDPGLTTLAQPSDLLGQLAFDTLLRVLAGEDLRDYEHIVPTEMVVRGSSAPPATAH